jgi:type IV secretory pathway TrbD component
MAAGENIEGFEVPVHTALSKPRLVAGIPRDVAVLNFTAAAALILGLQSWWSIPMYGVIHMAYVIATTYEPQWPEALRRNMRLKTHYRA